METISFIYNNSDFIFFCDSEKRTEFENKVCDSWDDAMKKGFFKYYLVDVESRIVPGEHRYIVQFNHKRFVERRKPQPIKHLKEPFDHERFNFTKIKPEEVILKLSKSLTENTEQSTALVIINVSPLEYGHILLVPDIDKCLNQVLSLRGIQYSIELMLLTNSKTFRVGFNSLCAHASVNHLHVHGWYVDHNICAESWTAEQLCDGCFVLNGSLVLGFGFEVQEFSCIDTVSRNIYKITQYLADNEVAHNMFLTRGNAFSNPNIHGIVRIILWPRVSVYGMKDDNLFNVAVAELSEHFPTRDKDGFHSITEKEIDDALIENSLNEEQFTEITSDVLKLL